MGTAHIPRPITVRSIRIYPIKGCAGVECDSATLTPSGFRHDRQFVLVDESGDFLSQRKLPHMATVKPEIRGDWLNLTAPKMPSVKISLRTVPNGHARHEIDIWGRKGRVFDLGADVNWWFSRVLQRQCRLLAYDPASMRSRCSQVLDANLPLHLQDGDPVHIVDRGALLQASGIFMNAARWRPNLIVDGCPPHATDTWRHIQVGDAHLDFARLCERCAVPLVNPSTGVRDLPTAFEPLKKYRILKNTEKDSKALLFGTNFAPTSDEEITIRVGDQIKVLN